MLLGMPCMESLGYQHAEILGALANKRFPDE